MLLKPVSSAYSDPDRLRGFEDCFSGYHRICLEKPYRIDYVSKNFCDLVGYCADDMQLFSEENYLLTVSESDRGRFMRFSDALAQAERTLTLQYTIKKKDGTELPVYNTTTSKRMTDGKMYGFSVVADVSGTQQARSVGETVSALIPYGYLQCSVEKYPKIVYVNQTLSDYLHIDEDPEKWTNNSMENIYFSLPFEERELFQTYLAKAKEASHPIPVDHHVYRSDGTLVHLLGWLSKIPGDCGKDEFGIVYRQVDDIVAEPEPIQNTSYFPVLKRSYDTIFVLDMQESMAECIHWNNDQSQNSMLGIQMTLESAKNFFLRNYIYPEDHNMMKLYLDQICNPDDDWGGRTALQSEFRIKNEGGHLRFISVAVHLDKDHVMLCCRDITDTAYLGFRDMESHTLHSLYRWMDYLSSIQDGCIGMLMLEQIGGDCHLLYGTLSVIHYLGLDNDDGSPRSTPPTLAECLAAADMTQVDFEQLVSGKHHYLWSRLHPGEYQFQISCNTYTQDDAVLYIIWCNKNDVRTDEDEAQKRVFARTFGHFDLFLDNTPITFSSSKEKELMALLIDRNGGTLSSAEAISYLWENEPADDHTSARYRKLAMGLRRTLEKYGISDILINHNGIRSVNTAAIRCDYYELLAGNAKYRQAFNNVYMSDYSWGEETLATLWNYS